MRTRLPIVGAFALGCFENAFIEQAFGIKHFQRFVNRNYALLPAVKDGPQITPILLRAVGIFLLWYGWTLAAGFMNELTWLGRMI